MYGLVVALLLAADLTPEKAAEVQNDRDKEFAKINKKYGDKPSSELSQDERREIIKDQQEAEQRVLDKHGVDKKEMARYEAKMPLDDREKYKEDKKRLQEKDKRAAEEKQKADEAKADKPVQVQHGFSDANPVVVEENENAGPVVEKGLPADAIEDYKQAGQNDPNSPPAAKGKSKSDKDR